MRSSARLVALAFVSAGLSLAALSSGCTSGTGVDDPGPDVAKERFAEQLGAAWCEPIGPCCAGVGLRYQAAGCKSFLSAQLQSQLSDPAVRYDPVAGGDCVRAAAAGAKECFSGASQGAFDAACRRVFVGTIAPGAPCTADAQCAVPAGAERASCDAGKCVVTTHGKKGDACSSTCDLPSSGVTSCWSAATTGGGTAICWLGDGLSCATDGTCQPVRAIGETCSYGTCTADAYCASDGTCEPAVPAGGSCASFETCAVGLSCVDAVCTAPNADGARCDVGSQCVSHYLRLSTAYQSRTADAIGLV